MNIFCYVCEDMQILQVVRSASTLINGNDGEKNGLNEKGHLYSNVCYFSNRDTVLQNKKVCGLWNPS